MAHTTFDINTDIATLIMAISDSVVHFDTSNVFGDELPVSPDNCISVEDNKGLSPIYTFSTGHAKIYQPSFQIVFRHLSKETMHRWVELVRDALDGKVSTIINGHFYFNISQVGDVFDLGRDNNRRHESMLNFTTMVDPWYT